MADASADSFDHASDIELAFREAAIARARQAEAVPKDFDGESCTDCGLEIPKGRLALGKFRCVHCQELKDKRDKQYAS